MTISAETIPYVADSILEMEVMCIPFSANLVFENVWGTPEKKEVLLETYAGQLARLVEYYVAHPELYPARIVDVKVEMASKDMLERKAQQESGDCERWCGAGHEMVVVEVDGSLSPCHRFSPWITGLPVPNDVNRQMSWKPEKCAQCKLIMLCPVCAGYNWQVNGDCGVRTTYHCEAFKLEAQASAKLQALRLLQQYPPKIGSLSTEEAYKLKCRIDSILEFATEGLSCDLERQPD
jgi:radical SAM protein with 4Fe4S-binding SPASM domain